MLKFLKYVLMFAAIAFGAVGFSGSSRASTVVVLGTDDIFAAGLGSDSGGGTVPSFIAVTAGETLKITATGIVFCCVGSPTPGVGPDGFASNPFGTGSSISNSTGSGVGSYFDPTGAFALAGYFLGAADNSVFKIGSDYTVIVPIGATALYFGLPDANGFNGASGSYADNGGSFEVTISAVPEPSTWAMIILGFAGISFAGYRRNRKANARFA